jgi:hypothetical protein
MVHYLVQKSPLLIVNLNQMNPVHTIQSYLSNIYFYYSPTYVLVFLVASFLLAFPSKSYMNSASHYSCYMPCQSHPY